MPRPRPKHVDVVHVLERDDGNFEMWADVGGKVLHFLVPAAAVVSRKLAHGLARIDITLEEQTLAGGERALIRTADEIVDLDPDAEGKAWSIVLEEHLDRFEDAGEDWHEQNPPLPPSNLKANRYKRRRGELEKRRQVRARKPQRVDPLVRFTQIGPDGEVRKKWLQRRDEVLDEGDHV